MSQVNVKEYLQKNKDQLKRIVFSLRSKNPEYSVENITSMVQTAIFLSKNSDPTKKEIYLNVLNRLLEEKGLSYNKGELNSPFVRVEEPGMLENNGEFDSQEQQPYEIIDEIFEQSGLNQDEVFVMALTYNMSTPNCLEGEYKKILDNIEGIYYIRELTKLEISKIMDVSVKEVTKLRKTAFDKMETYCEIKGIHWARGY